MGVSILYNSCNLVKRLHKVEIFISHFYQNIQFKSIFQDYLKEPAVCNSKIKGLGS